MTIGIVGLGLIGGSVGLALRDPSRTILGCDASEDSERVALDRFCVDRIAPLEEVAQSDVVFLAVPPSVVVSVAERVFAHASEQTVVTDCTSVKAEVARWAQETGHVQFVPGHPMAGHEKGGAAYSSAWMFRNARWILTPVKATAKGALRQVEELVRTMGASPVRIDPTQHDRQVAILSHLPHVVAAALVLTGEELERADTGGGSWRDLTRVGGVDPDLWTQIMMGNREELAKVLEEFEGRVHRFRASLEGEDRDGVWRLLAEARDTKERQATSPTEAEGEGKMKTVKRRGK